MQDTKYLEDLSIQIRRDILRMVNNADSGHPGGSMGCVEFFVALYKYIMNHNPENFSMDGKGEDLFFLSNGHISPVFYAILSRCGYFNIKEMSTFRKLNSRLQGHPSTHTNLEGVRISSGSLGQGLSVAIGAAHAKKLNNDKSVVFSLHGDGELQEGQIWEAVMYAGAKNVDNIIATIDFNGQQIDGPTEKVLPLGNISDKFKSFGWEILELDNGNDIREVIKYLELAKQRISKSKPICIIMKTTMGKGVDFMEGTHHWHGVAPNDKQLKEALNQLPETLGDY